MNTTQRCFGCRIAEGEYLVRCTDGSLVRLDALNHHVRVAMDNDLFTNNESHLMEVCDKFPGYPNETTVERVRLSGGLCQFCIQTLHNE